MDNGQLTVVVAGTGRTSDDRDTSEENEGARGSEHVLLQEEWSEEGRTEVGRAPVHERT